MKLGIDIDGVLCSEETSYERYDATPFIENIAVINQLYDDGHTIILFSARGWNEYDMTMLWLKNYGVKFHQLLCGKPIFDIFLDDRAVSTAQQLIDQVGEEHV